MHDTMLLSDLPSLAPMTSSAVKRATSSRDSASRAVAAAPVVTAPALVAHQRAFAQGWLEKKATWRFAWDRRYMLLDGDRLSYKVAEGQPEKGAGTVASLDCQAPNLQFTVWLVEGGSWTLRAANHTQFNTWVEALLTALKCDPHRPQTQTTANTVDDAGTATPFSSHHHQQHVDPAPDATRQESRPDGGNSPATPAGTAANSSVTASMILSPSVVPGTAAWSEPQLVSKVMKKGAWTGVWKPRIIELYDGHQLEYKSTADKSASRTRYRITTVDGSFNLHTDRQLFFTTSNGERFWVQFRSRTECAVWLRTVCESLRLNCAWRWLAYPSSVNAEGWSQWLSTVSRDAYAAVETHYHAAAIGPHPTVRGSAHLAPKVLYIFGGSREACRPTFQPAARSCVPFTTPANAIGELRLLELGGANNAETVDVQPFHERQHAKVRPRGVIGATLSPIGDAHGAAARLVLVGGTTGNVHDLSGMTRTEVWTAVIGPSPEIDERRIRVADVPPPSTGDDAAAAAPLAPPRWERSVFANYELPPLLFHAATTLDLLCAYNMNGRGSTVTMATPASSTALTAAASRDSLAESRTIPAADEPRPCREELEAQSESPHRTDEATAPARVTDSDATARAPRKPSPVSPPPPTRPVVLLTGGLDVSFRFRSEVWALVWPSSAEAGQGTASPQPCAVSLGFLPEPRAFHKTTVLADGTVVLVGGRVQSEPNGSEHALPVTVYTVSKSAWMATVRAQLAEDTPASQNTTSSLPWKAVEWSGDPVALGFSNTAVQNVSLAARGNDIFVLCSSRKDGEGEVTKLFRLSFLPNAPGDDDVIDSSPRQAHCEEVDILAGCAPPRVVGASLHYLRHSLYIVGASKRVDDEQSESVRYAILPPYRVLTD